MAKTVIGLFDSMNDAQKLVQRLEEIGYSRDNISIVSNNAGNRHAFRNDDVASPAPVTDQNDAVASDAGKGAVIGSVAGLVVGLCALAIPGIGPVIAAGPLATTLTGVGIGVVAGGIIGALVGMGVPEREAHFYAESVRRGSTLVIVGTTDEQANSCARLMHEFGAADIDRREQDLRQSGFDRFDDSGLPYSRERIDTEHGLFTSQQATMPASTIPVEGQTSGGVPVRVYHSNDRPIDADIPMQNADPNISRSAARPPMGDTVIHPVIEDDDIDQEDLVDERDEVMSAKERS